MIARSYLNYNRDDDDDDCEGNTTAAQNMPNTRIYIYSLFKKCIVAIREVHFNSVRSLNCFKHNQRHNN